MAANETETSVEAALAEAGMETVAAAELAPVYPVTAPEDEEFTGELTLEAWQAVNQRRSQDDAKRLFNALEAHGSVSVSGWSAPAEAGTAEEA